MLPSNWRNHPTDRIDTISTPAWVCFWLAGARLLWLLFAGYTIDMEILIFAICRSLQINTGETIFTLTGGALTIMGFHMMASVSTVDHGYRHI